MRAIPLAICIYLAGTTALLAGPATTSATVNVRSGPGTQFDRIGSIPEGTSIDVSGCDSTGTWCAIAISGKEGFVSGKYLNEESGNGTSWPRTFTTKDGGEITLFQPQITEWDRFTVLKALVAAEYRPSGKERPAFGTIGFTADTVADRDSGEVVLTDVKLTEINFSPLDRQQLADLSLEIGKIVPTGPLTLSEDRLTASLADYQRTGNVEGLKSDPPPIFVSDVPAILVQTDGKEVVAPVKAVEGLSFVVNTNWDLFKTGDGSYYLRDEKSWLSAQELSGNWQPVTKLPDQFSRLPDDESWKDARAAIPPSPSKEGDAPKVFYSDKPAELIQFDGRPKLEPVGGTGLEWASNTDSDVFFDRPAKTWYVLLSGRWFSSASLDGPWTFATPDLPADFQNIPDDAPYASVRASVPDTSENAEARLKANIPQMARVATDGSVKAEPVYSGDPVFKPIEGTKLSYAVNTNDRVIEVGSKYYLVKDGVWFVSDSPSGPFVVVRSVPKEIYAIPPASPVYDVTYVRVYRTEDDAVWFGYTMGYLGAFLAWDTFVYGTGWYYPPYWGAAWRGPYEPYYPRPVTYGIAAAYNPALGTYGRYGYAYGPYRGIAAGAAYNPRTGTYIRGGAVAGPAGQRGFVAAYNPRTGTGAVARGGSTVYGSWNTASVRSGSQWARTSAGSLAGGGEAARWRTSAGNSGFVAGGRNGDVYAGRDGNVYRRQDGEWQKHTPGGGWSPVQKPSTEN